MNIAIAPNAEAAPDLEAIKKRQHAAWSDGDYATVGTTLQIVGERIAEALDLRSGQRVLDVAAGNGNASLAAARRWCDVVSTDYVVEWLNRGRTRADAEGLKIEFRVADAEDLPFENDSFDAVLSTFGVMFAPNQEKSASEMLRVCRRGGKIGLANWTPDSFIGDLFKTIGRHVPAPAGVKAPSLWGTKERLEELFADAVSAIDATPQKFVFRYRSAGHWIDVWRQTYGPTKKAFAAVGDQGEAALEKDLHALVARHNMATDGTMVVPASYLEVVVAKR